MGEDVQECEEMGGLSDVYPATRGISTTPSPNSGPQDICELEDRAAQLRS